MTVLLSDFLKVSKTDMCRYQYTLKMYLQSIMGDQQSIIIDNWCSDGTFEVLEALDKLA